MCIFSREWTCAVECSWNILPDNYSSGEVIAEGVFWYSSTWSWAVEFLPSSQSSLLHYTGARETLNQERHHFFNDGHYFRTKEALRSPAANDEETRPDFSTSQSTPWSVAIERHEGEARLARCESRLLWLTTSVVNQYQDNIYKKSGSCIALVTCANHACSSSPMWASHSIYSTTYYEKFVSNRRLERL